MSEIIRVWAYDNCVVKLHEPFRTKEGDYRIPVSLCVDGDEVDFFPVGPGHSAHDADEVIYAAINLSEVDELDDMRDTVANLRELETPWLDLEFLCSTLENDEAHEWWASSGIFDYVQTAYVFCATHYTGQWCPLYAFQCRISQHFRPGIPMSVPEGSEDYHDDLKAIYSPGGIDVTSQWISHENGKFIEIAGCRVSAVAHRVFARGVRREYSWYVHRGEKLLNTDTFATTPGREIQSLLVKRAGFLGLQALAKLAESEDDTNAILKAMKGAP